MADSVKSSSDTICLMVIILSSAKQKLSHRQMSNVIRIRNSVYMLKCFLSTVHLVAFLMIKILMTQFEISPIDVHGFMF